MEERDRPPKLDYVTPATQRGEVSTGQVVGGALLSVLAVVTAVPLSVSIGFTARTVWGGVVAALILVGVAGGLTLLALRSRHDPRRRGFAQGIWIGMGIAVLLEGVCFLMIA